MNATAARRVLAQKALENSIPRNLVSQDAVPHVQNGARTRGRSLVRGLPVQLTYASIDAVLVCLVGIAVIWLRFSFGFPSLSEAQAFTRTALHAYGGFFLLYATFVVFGCATQDLYRTPRDRSVFDESMMVGKAVSIATTILVVFIFISGYKDISRLVIVSSGALNWVVLSGWRYFKRRVVLRRAAAGIGISRVLIVGAGPMGSTLGEWLNSNRQLGYQVCGYLDRKPSANPQILGTVDDLRKIAITQFADEVFVTVPSDRQLVKKIALEAYELRLGLKIFPDLYDGLGWSAPLHMIGGFPVMDLHWQPIPRVGQAVKRLMDILVSCLALALTSPLLAVSAIFICLDSSGPAIYCADRIGLKGKKFTCYKLRTMVVDADALKDELRAANERNGPFFKMQHDPRITRIGRWLRKLSIDELPQLWNVLRGEMSLVGPRPHPLDDYRLYSLEHLRRLDVCPGLTGPWQVSARTDPSFERSMALDLDYIERWSLGLDLKILLQTIPAVFRAEGR